jgi:hypothetical protein
MDFVDLGSTYTSCLCLFMVRKWYPSYWELQKRLDLLVVKILYVKLLLLQVKVGLFLAPAFCILWKSREESFSKCAPSLFCLGLGESTVGSFKCVLIICSIETTKRQWYADESKLEEIWSPRCALKIEVIADSSSGICHSIWVHDYHKLG